jgi:hypothetical protein
MVFPTSIGYAQVSDLNRDKTASASFTPTLQLAMNSAAVDRNLIPVEHSVIADHASDT